MHLVSLSPAAGEATTPWKYRLPRTSGGAPSGGLSGCRGRHRGGARSAQLGCAACSADGSRLPAIAQRALLSGYEVMSTSRGCRSVQVGGAVGLLKENRALRLFEPARSGRNRSFGEPSYGPPTRARGPRLPANLSSDPRAATRFRREAVTSNRLVLRGRRGSRPSGRAHHPPTSRRRKPRLTTARRGPRAGSAAGPEGDRRASLGEAEQARPRVSGVLRDLAAARAAHFRPLARKHAR